MNAQVIKCLSSECLVEQNGKEFSVSLRGKLKKEPQSVLVGDYVMLGENNSIIESVLPRKNRLIRPFVVNVDQIVVVASEEPKSDLFVIDQIIIGAAEQNLPVLLVVNKMDISSKEFASSISSDYSKVVSKIVEVSAKTGENINELKKLLKGKLSVLVGESGVGKSSLINAIFCSEKQEIGNLSQKISRGKNTTRSNQIFACEDGIKIIDSPGFSSLSLGVIDPQELARKFIDFNPYTKQCAYTSCNHISSDGCAVKKAVQCGKISKNRYDRYCKLYQKYSDEWQNRYKRKKEKNNENFTINNSRRLQKRTKAK